MFNKCYNILFYHQNRISFQYDDDDNNNNVNEKLVNQSIVKNFGALLIEVENRQEVQLHWRTNEYTSLDLASYDEDENEIERMNEIINLNNKDKQLFSHEE